jgi:hypothetical protein
MQEHDRFLTLIITPYLYQPGNYDRIFFLLTNLTALQIVSVTFGYLPLNEKTSIVKKKMFMKLISHKHHLFKSGEVLQYLFCWYTLKTWSHCSPFRCMHASLHMASCWYNSRITGIAKQQEWHFIVHPGLQRPAILLSPAHLRCQTLTLYYQPTSTNLSAVQDLRKHSCSSRAGGKGVGMLLNPIMFSSPLVFFQSSTPNHFRSRKKNSRDVGIYSSSDPIQ